MGSPSYLLAPDQRDPNKLSHSTTTSPAKNSKSPTPPYSTMAMTASIPIPRMAPSHSPQYPTHSHPHPSHHPALPSPSQHSSSSHTRMRSPSVGRSPLSAASYRSHPYRRASQPIGETLPRIHLPPPNSGAPLKLHEQTPSPRELYPPSEAPWRSERERDRERDRPSMPRIPSGGQGGFSLPPLHAMTGPPRAHSPSLPPPPQMGPLPPRRSLSDRSSPRMYPPSITVGTSTNSNLRPNVYEPRDRSPSVGVGAGPSRYVDHERERENERARELDRSEREREEAYEHHRRRESIRHPQPSHPHPSHHRHSHSVLPPHPASTPVYSDAPSPPLRALPSTALPAPNHYSYTHPQSARSRSQSTGSGMSRPGAGTISSEEGPDGLYTPMAIGMGMNIGMGGYGGAGPAQGREIAPTPGQSRRLAHLMSEQKRRESINSGFQALRGVLPSALATDSKAIILRKAVSHIAHLEATLRRAGVPWSAAPSASGSVSGSGYADSGRPSYSGLSEGERERGRGTERELWVEDRGDEDELDREREERIKWEEES